MDQSAQKWLRSGVWFLSSFPFRCGRTCCGRHNRCQQPQSLVTRLIWIGQLLGHEDPSRNGGFRIVNWHELMHEGSREEAAVIKFVPDI